MAHGPIGEMVQREARLGIPGGELGPQGVHVAHVVIDGAIDTAFIRDNFPERYAAKADAGILDPEHIAESYWMLHRQPRDAWTHELDLRPWREAW